MCRYKSAYRREIFAINCGSLSVSRCVGIPYGYKKLSRKAEENRTNRFPARERCSGPSMSTAADSSGNLAGNRKNGF